MKKSFLASMTLSALLMASCANDDLFEQPSNGGNVTFTAELPAAMLSGSRAFSDGYTATQLKYAVYEAGTTNALITSDAADAPQATFSDRVAKLTLDLAQGKSYDVVFWAQDPAASCYTFDPATQSVTINYAGITSGDEGRDAFFQVEKGITVNGSIQKTVELRRPFAQLNWGASDLEAAHAAGLDVTAAQVTVSNVYSKLNLFTGVASEGTEVTFAKAELPTGETFPIQNHTYLAMDYVLTGVVPADNNVHQAQSEVVDCSITLYDENAEVNTIAISNVPVQRNYRTNIYGKLLTSTIDYTIEIKPDYEDDHNQSMDVNEPQQDKDGVYMITTPEELAYVAKNPTIWKGKTLKLMNDIDLQNTVWHPIGYNKKDAAQPNEMDWFEGTFDGNHKTISNFICNEKGDYAVAGLFGAVRGNIKNLYIEKADIRSEHYAGGLVAYSHQNAAHLYNDKDFPKEGFSITGCRVNNSTIVTTPNKQADGSYDNGDKAGALIGYVNSLTTIENCDVRNNTIEGYRDLGGLIGYIGGNQNFQITINKSWSINNTIKQQYAKGYKEVGKVYNHVDYVYGWCDKEPLIKEGGQHSNTIYIYNMAPTNAAELAQALKYPGEGTTFTLGEYTYEMGDNNFTPTGKNFKVVGAGQGKTIVKIKNCALNDANVEMENMTIELPAASYNGFMNHRNGKFTNIEFKGCLWTWGTESVTYNNCTFDGSEGDVYPLWIKLTANATLNDCKVISKNGRGIMLCGDADFNNIPVHDVTINGCEFVVKEAANDKAAFEIHTEADGANVTGTIRLNNVTYPADKYIGLWREINNNDESTTQIFNIYEDGKLVQKGR